MADLPGVEVLQTEIEKARDKLKGYNENIKKLTGRDPSGPGIRRLISTDGSDRNEEHDNFPSMGMGRGGIGRGRGRVFGLPRRTVMEDTGPPVKRRTLGGAFSRLGPVPAGNRWRGEREDSPYKEELPNKLSVHSSVVSTSREAKDRKEILAEQGKDKEGLQRNRRMFGLLLGTLSKFKTDSKALQTKEERRKKIDQKLEENAAKEKRKFQQETKLLVEEMHLEQAKISRLQQKMDMVAEHGEREEEMKKLKNFIVTRTRPKIFWLPRTMNTVTDNKLKESTKVVDKMLQEGRDRLENEIKDLMNRETKREERIKMRLREDGLLDEDGKGDEAKDTGQGDQLKNGDNISNMGHVIKGVKEEESEEDEPEEEEEDDNLLQNKTRRVVLEREEGEADDDYEEKGSNKDKDQGENKVGELEEKLEGEKGEEEVEVLDHTVSESLLKQEISKKPDIKSEQKSDESSSDSEEEREVVEKEDSIPRRVVELEDRVVTIVKEAVEQESVEIGNDGDARLVEHQHNKDNLEESDDKNKDSTLKEGIQEETDNVKGNSEDENKKVKKRGDKDSERKDRKKRHDRDASEEMVKRRRRYERDTSEEKETKKREESSKDKSRRRRGDDDRHRSRRDSRDRERGRRDSRDRDRSKRDKRESKSHRKDKSKNGRIVEEVDIKKEIDEKNRSEDRHSKKDKHKLKSGLMAEDEDVDMQSD